MATPLHIDIPDEQRRREAVAARVTKILRELDTLVDAHTWRLEADDAAAVRVFAHDARQPLEQLNAKLLRIPPSQR